MTVYPLIRILFAIPLGVLLWWLLRRKSRKMRGLISITAVILAFSVLLCMPIENAFYSFKTPEQAFRYQNGGSAKIIHVEDGENASAVVCFARGDFSTAGFCRDANGYNLHNYFSPAFNAIPFVNVSQQARGILLRSTRGTESFIIVESKLEVKTISDSSGSEFHLSTHGTRNVFSAQIFDLMDDYLLYVNGEKITVFRWW